MITTGIFGITAILWFIFYWSFGCCVVAYKDPLGAQNAGAEQQPLRPGTAGNSAHGRSNSGARDGHRTQLDFAAKNEG